MAPGHMAKSGKVELEAGSSVPWKGLLSSIQMGAAQLGRFTRAPPVPGERFLGSFSRARGEFSAAGLPLLLWVGSF